MRPREEEPTGGSSEIESQDLYEFLSRDMEIIACIGKALCSAKFCATPEEGMALAQRDSEMFFAGAKVFLEGYDRSILQHRAPSVPSQKK